MPVQDSEFVAIAVEDAKNGKVKLEMRNKFSVGDTLEILSPKKDCFNKNVTIKEIIDSTGEKIESAKKVQEIVEINMVYPEFYS